MENKSIENLSDIVVHMKYAKYSESLQRRETWSEIVDRNKAMHIKKFPNLVDSIEHAYKYVYDKKILPSMRSMQFAGKPIELSPNRIYNCSYLPIEDVNCFSETMFLLLSGCGVGFSVQKHHIEKLPFISKPHVDDKGNYKKRRFLISDSIEGWADSIKQLMKAFLDPKVNALPDFDFNDIRHKGAKLITSGGKAPGADPLKKCLFNIQLILEAKNHGDRLTTLEVHDIVCHIADAVLAGGIRRAALISFFSFDDLDMINCKYGNWWETNPQRGRSNNSAVILRSLISEEEFDQFWEKIKNSGSGEPGIYFTNDRDVLSNPCCEISLKPYQFCNLCEINVSDLETQEEFNERAKAATIIGTLQAAYTDFHYLRPIWKKTTEKEALIGIGLTGIGSGKVLNLDMKQAAKIVKDVNKQFAKILGINKAARTTTIKPSGSAATVLGCSSGIHAWYDVFYIRRMRLNKDESLYKYLKRNIPELIEDDFLKPKYTAILSIPQRSPIGAILRTESPIDLLERVKKIKRNRESNQTVYRKILSIILLLSFKIIKFLVISSLKNQRKSV